jgi:redox-sensitive bicupin YhaK (pirin superfamily)
MHLHIPARLVNVGGTQISRLLPYAKKRMVGPFIFFDHMPHSHFPAGEGMDVRPHPHIGLSTLSYLLEGQVLHHDSLGNKQLLRPGDVNWMTAGQGIAHSERMPEELKSHAYDIQLMQFWIALPLDFEDAPPAFTHHPEHTIPKFSIDGSEITLIAGDAFDQESPVEVFSKLFFMQIKTQSGKTFEFDPHDQELAFYILSGELLVDEINYKQGDFVVMPFREVLKVQAHENTTFVILGGHAFAEERIIYWNFVASSKHKIEAAKVAWQNGSFPQVPGETDNIPLPADK